jgi:MFS family permease
MDTPPQFKDRRTGLIVFGILEILCGTFCLLVIPLMIAGQTMAGRMGGGPPQFRMVVPAILVYGLMAAIFLTLGIGSIRARRWARAFSLILGWSWLLMGALGFVVYAFILPKIIFKGAAGAPNLPEPAKLIIIFIAMAVIGLVFVVLPLALVLFYRSKHVLATCEARDRMIRWTDRCPLPVLALSSWLGLGGVCLLLMPLVYRGVAPFFGVLISGVAGGAYYIVIAAVFLYLSRAVYQLKPAAWWLVLGFLVVSGVSNLLTFSHVDLIEMYRRMGYPEAHIRQLQQYNFLQNNYMLVCSALGFVPLLGYLLYVRKFFRHVGNHE